ncbi:MAG: hypothetical protein IJA82_02765 [Clostridia bacterium]|nr:hypothetical protein [Clostridia bacterium]
MKKLKLPLLYLLSFVCSVGPVLIFFFINLERYTKTVPQTVKLSAGGIIVLIIAFLKVIGKLKLPSRMTVFAIVFLLTYLLESVISDIMILSFLALVGEVLDAIVSIFIKREKQKNTEEKTAQITADVVKKALSGRV